MLCRHAIWKSKLEFADSKVYDDTFSKDIVSMCFSLQHDFRHEVNEKPTSDKSAYLLKMA